MTATRILATLGPATSSLEGIRALAEAGASAFRLNFTHGTHEVLGDLIGKVREVATALGRPIAIVGDLAGPKLRTRAVKDGGTVTLSTGQRVIVSGEDAHTTDGRIAVAWSLISEVVGAGQQLLLDDGRLVLEVNRVKDGEIEAVVVHGGELGSKKGLNLPGSAARVSSITQKDQADLDFALEHDIEWLALSFVQGPRDVVDLKRRIAVAGGTTPVIAKIEKPIAVQNLEGILDVSDGIMVARGDLGVEMGPEVLPIVQKTIIKEARKRSKLVITATEMLESMTRQARPTRAEASDVANAIFDGTDVVMLSQETAVGVHPVRAVETMRAIALRVEASDLYRDRLEVLDKPEGGGIAYAAIRAASVAADEAGARAILVFSDSGWTAASLASWRPLVDIYALTQRPVTARRLALCWGLTPATIPRVTDMERLYPQGVETLKRRGAIQAGDIVVLLSGAQLIGRGANTLKIMRVS